MMLFRALLWLVLQGVAGSGLANSKMVKETSSSSSPATDGATGTNDAPATATAPAAEASSTVEEKKEGDDPPASCQLIYPLI